MAKKSTVERGPSWSVLKLAVKVTPGERAELLSDFGSREKAEKSFVTQVKHDMLGKYSDRARKRALEEEEKKRKAIDKRKADAEIRSAEREAEAAKNRKEREDKRKAKRIARHFEALKADGVEVREVKP